MSAAAGGAVTSTFVRVPTDTLRHRVQAYLHPNVVRAIPELMQRKGLGGFYAGFHPTLARDVPEIAIQFAVYECLRTLVQRDVSGSAKKLATWQHLVLGGISGALAACTTMPIDVLKTQMQCGGPEAVRLGFVGTLKEIVSAKGPSGLIAGMVCSVCLFFRLPNKYIL
jgi:solute carrier family 25 S-adenosylmethionine transporter 26